MKITWIGQAGLLFEAENICVMIDPYLSDSVKKVNPANYRRVPVEERFLEIKPDVLILTHNHLDHTDPETLEVLLKKHSGICVLASQNAWREVRKYGGNHNYISFNHGTVWTMQGRTDSQTTDEKECQISFEAVYADHSDDHAIGVVIRYQGKVYYITGDTLYNKKVVADASKHADMVFLPINGVGNNMNMIDAARFSEEIQAKQTVPIHFGMFDELNPKEFLCATRVIPTMYKETNVWKGEKWKD